MRKYLPMMLALACSTVLLLGAGAQPPGGDKEKDYSNSSIVKGMLAFDKDKTGKLTKEMVTDPRLHRLFDRADVNKDGAVTREELIALAAKIDAEFPPGKGFGKGKDGFGKDKKKKDKKKDFGDKE